MLHTNKFLSGLSSAISKLINTNNRMIDKIDGLQKTVDEVKERVIKLEKKSDNETKIHTESNFIKVRNYTYVDVSQFF